MNNNNSALSFNRSPSWVERLVQICDRFEADWRAGLRPRISEIVRDLAEPEQSGVLRMLLALELRLRRERGERPTRADYQREFSGRDELIDSAFDSLTATGSAANGDPTTSRDEMDTRPHNPDATLTYSVGGNGGKVAPWIDAVQHRRLRGAFARGEVVLRRYRIDQELGRGGMGVVFLGRDLRLDRSVAIKVCLLQKRNDYRDESRLAALRGAFAEEARLGANLTHPAIATVYDYGFHDDKPFTVFEYLPGETLRDLLRRRGRLPLEEVRLIVGPLAQALDFAHARRVVHRDLKPDNVRATEQGLFKVLDLGLAREFGRDLDWSGFSGTPAYASPEQASGLPCDGRADQYALALIAFELLTGRRLFQARDTHDLLEMHRETEPTGLATDLTDCPRGGPPCIGPGPEQGPERPVRHLRRFRRGTRVPTPQRSRTGPRDPDGGRRRADDGRVARPLGQLPWLKDTVHLALTREAIWSAYHSEVRRWPLSDVERIEPRSDPIDDRRGDRVGREPRSSAGCTATPRPTSGASADCTSSLGARFAGADDPVGLAILGGPALGPSRARRQLVC